eukprot:6179147-Pleurochrysis_carterae.AAC.1
MHGRTVLTPLPIFSAVLPALAALSTAAAAAAVAAATLVVGATWGSAAALGDGKLCSHFVQLFLELGADCLKLLVELGHLGELLRCGVCSVLGALD